MLTEYFHDVTFLGINSRKVYHAHIHADVSDYWSEFAVYPNFAVPIAQMSVQSIGISNRNSTNDRVALQNTFSAVSDSFGGWHMLDLQNVCLQCADFFQQFVVNCTDTIMTNTQTYHIELIVAEPFNTSRVEYMGHYFVVERFLNLVFCSGEPFYLFMGEVVEAAFV